MNQAYNNNTNYELQMHFAMTLARVIDYTCEPPYQILRG